MHYKIRNNLENISKYKFKLYFLGICYEKLGQSSKALDCYKQASWRKR
jgi:tetratricopeptide (TPR) repeat protein